MAPIQPGDRVPRVSVGVPVRNGETFARRCIESVLAQDFADLEVVICDNASTDGTREILADLARHDSRIRVHGNPHNIGQIGNFNRVFALARGEYFCWLGIDDCIEPQFVSRCVAALDANPDAVLATTWFSLDEDGVSRCVEYAGEFLESSRPERRVERALWFFHAGAELFDPMHGMVRRALMPEPEPLAPHINNDWLFVVEAALRGRFVHVPAKLLHRSWRSDPLGEQAPARKRSSAVPVRDSVATLAAGMIGAVRAAPLSRRARARCIAAILRFALREARLRALFRIRLARRRALRGMLGRLRGVPGPSRT